jgi:hypothetical protein
MGRFVDVGKGSGRRSADVPHETFLEKHEAIFGESKVKAGSFKQDPETGKFIDSYEWHQKYGRQKVRTHFVSTDIEPYESLVTGNIINSRRAQRYDLESTGSRIYEGREAEQKEADRHNAHKEALFDRKLDNSLKEVANDLKYQNIKPEKRIKSSWLIGED